MHGSYRFDVEHEPDPLDLAFLEERMSAAAVAAVGLGAEEEFGIFAREDNQIVAGTFGAIWGGCCQVHVVWVDEARRACGVGRALMAQTEAEARRRGCRLIMGLTYDALIGDFYDRLGYRTVGAIEDCPAGTTTRWYCKDL